MLCFAFTATQDACCMLLGILLEGEQRSCRDQQGVWAIVQQDAGLGASTRVHQISVLAYSQVVLADMGV
jgi:hypothetical protein